MSFGALRNSLLVLVVIGALLWVVTPIARTGALFISLPGRHAPRRPAGLRVVAVTFAASDGVSLQGWLRRGAAASPAVVLVPGFKDNRSPMVPYARMLSHAG
jgi:hypothetical protein